MTESHKMYKHVDSVKLGEPWKPIVAPLPTCSACLGMVVWVGPGAYHMRCTGCGQAYRRVTEIVEGVESDASPADGE